MINVGKYVGKYTIHWVSGYDMFVYLQKKLKHVGALDPFKLGRIVTQTIPQMRCTVR